MQVVWLPSALLDLQRLRNFLRSNNPEAARRAAATIIRTASGLEIYPYLGREVDGLPGFYDMAIPFGEGSYTIRYKIHQEWVFIVLLRHSKEAGFSEV